MIKRILRFFGLYEPVVIDLGYGYGCRPINKWLIDNVGKWKGHKFHGSQSGGSTCYGNGWRVHAYRHEGKGYQQVVEIYDKDLAILFRLWV